MAVLRAAEPVTLNASQLLSRGSRGRKPDAASSLSPRAQPVRRSYLVPSSYVGSAGQVPEMHGASRADPDLEHVMKTSRDEDDIKAAKSHIRQHPVDDDISDINKRIQNIENVGAASSLGY